MKCYTSLALFNQEKLQKTAGILKKKTKRRQCNNSQIGCRPYDTKHSSDSFKLDVEEGILLQFLE